MGAFLKNSIKEAFKTYLEIGKRYMGLPKCWAREALGTNINNVPLIDSYQLWAQSYTYIPSTLNIELILWNTQLIVCAVRC